MFNCWVNSQENLNQILRYTRCITPNRVTNWRGPSLRHCARGTQHLLKKPATLTVHWQHNVQFDWPEI